MQFRKALNTVEHYKKKTVQGSNEQADRDFELKRESERRMASKGRKISSRKSSELKKSK
jgi:hypothetical protein